MFDTIPDADAIFMKVCSIFIILFPLFSTIIGNPLDRNFSYYGKRSGTRLLLLPSYKLT
jgi:hypothetical protein